MLQQEIRVGGLAEAGLVHCERLVDEEGSRSERAEEGREQRPVEVVDDDDQVVELLAEVNLAGLEVHDARFDREIPADGLDGQLIDRPAISIDGHDGEPSFCQEQGVPSPPAGYVERVACVREKLLVGKEPERRAGVTGHAPG
jgi:hypothetical protein